MSQKCTSAMLERSLFDEDSVTTVFTTEHIAYVNFMLLFFLINCFLIHSLQTLLFFAFHKAACFSFSFFFKQRLFFAHLALTHIICNLGIISAGYLNHYCFRVKEQKISGIREIIFITMFHKCYRINSNFHKWSYCMECSYAFHKE